MHDPLDELPVRTVLRGVFMECDLIGSCEAIARYPRTCSSPTTMAGDDWAALDGESAAVVPVA